MSTTATPSQSSSQQQRVRCTCNYCNEEFWKSGGYNSDFCSYRCRSLGAAQGLLGSLRRDHTRCASCFRKLKEVFHPGAFYVSQSGELRSTPECFVGLEASEPGYEWGIGEDFARDPSIDEWDVHPSGEQSTKVCECGVTHHSTVMFGGVENFKANLSKRELTTRCRRLITFVESESDWRIDHDAVFEKLRGLKQELSNKGADWKILKYALAAGIRAAG